jgi:hypothetical protein
VESGRKTRAKNCESVEGEFSLFLPFAAHHWITGFRAQSHQAGGKARISSVMFVKHENIPFFIPGLIIGIYQFNSTL